ncbi:hypothetical protein WJX73_008240 [Symbiochloris irregularis]|uniref:PsbP C-terminal domain-containing protein n=1 Tax=Symbiochloris irregularis TaxID=706552 RepID=A0AAW1NPC9_9CHLO
MILASVNFSILGSTAVAPDFRTAVNSLLGAYGLPRLKDTPGFRLYDDYDIGCAFDYPKAWVLRPNRERRGVYISDFNTADKASLEVFDKREQDDLTTAVIAKHSNPAAETGGDARLLLPEQKRIKSNQETIDGQGYLYLAYPSETVTRSGYQIQRKNFTVAAVRNNTVYTLNVRWVVHKQRWRAWPRNS